MSPTSFVNSIQWLVFFCQLEKCKVVWIKVKIMLLDCLLGHVGEGRLNWWQELSTGQFHCYGFESAPIQKINAIVNDTFTRAFIGSGGRTPVRFLSVRAGNSGSHQCKHWWQELSTGQFHCYGFESTHIRNNKWHSECIIHCAIYWCR